MASITFKAIVPKTSKLIDQRKLNRELKGALGKTGDIIRGDFKKTIRTWTNKPSFQKQGPKIGRDGLEVEVFTNHEVYFYVTRGTRAHIIRPVRTPSLRFRAGFSPKTRVRVIGSRGGEEYLGRPCLRSRSSIQEPRHESSTKRSQDAARRTLITLCGWLFCVRSKM